MTSKNKKESYEELYVCMQDVTEKRKSILLGIKNSLIMQEEQEKILEIRHKKTQISKEIKKSLEEINLMYNDIRKSLPNVKNILSYTEKEINELENQLNSLKIDNQQTQKDIKLGTTIKDDLIKTSHGFNSTKNNLINKSKNETKEKSKSKDHLYAIGTKSKISKLDRIQNNLKVIEAKLKSI